MSYRDILVFCACLCFLGKLPILMCIVYRIPMSPPQRYAIRGYTLRKNQEEVLEFAESKEVQEVWVNTETE